MQRDRVTRLGGERNGLDKRLAVWHVSLPMRPRSHARTGSISARMLLRIVDYVAAGGHDANALCRSAGLQLAVLRQPEVEEP